MNFLMIQPVIKCFEGSTVETVQENFELLVPLFIYTCDNVNKYDHVEMTHKKLINRRNDLAQD